MAERAEMSPLMLLQLSLFVVAVSSSKFSHVILQQHPNEINSCGRNEQLLIQLQETVSKMQEELAKLTAGSPPKKPTGKLKNIEK